MTVCAKMSLMHLFDLTRSVHNLGYVIGWDETTRFNEKTKVHVAPELFQVTIEKVGTRMFHPQNFDPGEFKYSWTYNPPCHPTTYEKISSCVINIIVSG